MSENRSSVVQNDISNLQCAVRSGEKDYSWVPSLFPGFFLAQGLVGLTAETGLSGTPDFTSGKMQFLKGY
jgi:hypothetical protein